MLEPIQGEAGIKIPPKGYLKEIQITSSQGPIYIQEEITLKGLWTASLFLAVKDYLKDVDLKIYEKYYHICEGLV